MSKIVPVKISEFVIACIVLEYKGDEERVVNERAAQGSMAGT